MTFYVDSSVCLHPKAIAAGTAALGLWTLAGSWSAANNTHGYVPGGVVTMLAASDGPQLADKLVDAGLWEHAAGGYRFHQWAEHQPADKIRKARQEAGRRGGIASGVTRRRQSLERRREPAAVEAKTKQNEALASEKPTKQNEAKRSSVQPRQKPVNNELDGGASATQVQPGFEANPSHHEASASFASIESTQSLWVSPTGKPIKNLTPPVVPPDDDQRSKPVSAPGSKSTSTPARKPAPSARGSRLPGDFTATPTMIEWARTNTPLVGRDETAAFVDYWQAETGQRATKRDWVAAWRTWMRRAQKDAQRRSPPQQRAPANGYRSRTDDNIIAFANRDFSSTATELYALPGGDHAG